MYLPKKQKRTKLPLIGSASFFCSYSNYFKPIQITSNQIFSTEYKRSINEYSDPTTCPIETVYSIPSE